MCRIKKESVFVKSFFKIRYFLTQRFWEKTQRGLSYK